MKKKIYKFALIFAAASTLSSCEEYLHETNESGVGYDFLETKVGIESASNDIYRMMRWYVSNESFNAMTEFGCDHMWEGADGGRKDAFNKYLSSLNPTRVDLYDMWKNVYLGITRANTVLLKLPEVKDLDDATRTIREAEMRFMRAYYYFDLVRQFGRIPIVLDGNVGDIITEYTRSDIKDVYKQILVDLDFAYQNLPAEQKQRGRATKGAAAHLLSLVYLTRGSAVADQRGQTPEDMAMAAKYADEVINSGVYQLEPNIADYYAYETQKASKEIIFDIQCTEDLLIASGLGNKQHLYFCGTYELLPGMKRDIFYGRPWKRLRVTPYTLTQLYDRKNDSRVMKSFTWVYLCNNEKNIPKWKEKYFYVDENGKTTDEVLYAPPAELVGKNKFSVGDTAAVFSPVFLGARDAVGKVLDKAKDKALQKRIAESSYTYFAIDNYDARLYPTMQKWTEPKRANVNDELGGRNFIRMRLAETYLIAAEAYGRMGNMDKAVEYINIVRTRAGYEEGEAKDALWVSECGFDPAEALASTKDAMKITRSDIESNFVDFMLDERSRELYGELMRWYDLVRTEKLVERAKKYNPDAAPNIQPYHKLRPIPQNHIDRLTNSGGEAEEQNEGYY